MKRKLWCTIHYSGHMHSGSPYETDDSCGNCDGARCETCRKVYQIEDFDTGELIYIGRDKKRAEELGWKKEGVYEIEV